MLAFRSEFTGGLLQERHDGMKVILAQKARLCLQEREAGAVDRCAAVEHGQRSRDGRFAVAPVVHALVEEQFTRAERRLMGAVVADGRLRDPVLIVADDRHLAVLE